MLRFALLYLDSPLMALLIWLLSPAERGGAWQLPVFGFAVSTLLIGVGMAVAKLMGLKRAEQGAFICGSAMSNIGFSYGGLLCLVILGMDGLTLSQVYTMYLTPFTFLIMFQVAAWYASDETAPTLRSMFFQFLRHPARWLPILAMGIGVGLNLLAPRPPEWLKPVAAVWVFCATGLYSLAIGISIRLGKVREHVAPCLALGAVKFVVTPLLALALTALFDLTPLQRQVVFVESAMPMAIYAVVLAGLTGLARDMANSCWLFTTLAALPLVAPIYLIVTRLPAAR